MPRKGGRKKADAWIVSTKPELFSPVWEKRHESASESITSEFIKIEDIYDKVAKILDENGVIGNVRLLYRSFAERLYHVATLFKGKAAQDMANAVTVLFVLYGGDVNILERIAMLLGFKVEIPLMGSLLRTVEVSGNYTAKAFEYVLVDASVGNITIKLPETLKNTIIGVKKIDPTTNVVDVIPETGFIDGDTKVTLDTQYMSFLFIFDGENWWIM